MSGILQIVANTILSVMGFVFIIWVILRTLKKTEDAPKLIFKWIFTVFFAFYCIGAASKLFIFGPFVIVFMGVVLSIMWTPHISEWLSSPVTGLFDGGSEPPVPKPLYSTALSKRKSNKPLEAIVAVREQLAKFPNDYEGVMLLATIQAEDMKDLQSAEISVNNFCNSPKAPDKQVAAAWTQLADWHLSLVKDVDSARSVLEKIIARFPGTILASQAAQRIAHLEGSTEQLLAPLNRQAMAVPNAPKNLGFRASIAEIVPEEENPQILAANYVKHLEKHPYDAEIREKLAIIYASHYKRLDLAAAQLNQLAELPDQPPKWVAHWLNLLADLQVKGGASYDEIHTTLSKIVELFPDLPVAEVAKSRLNHLKLEIKGKNVGPENKTLGVYEQNIGLKYGRPDSLR